MYISSLITINSLKDIITEKYIIDSHFYNKEGIKLNRLDWDIEIKSIEVAINITVNSTGHTPFLVFLPPSGKKNDCQRFKSRIQKNIKEYSLHLYDFLQLNKNFRNHFMNGIFMINRQEIRFYYVLCDYYDLYPSFRMLSSFKLVLKPFDKIKYGYPPVSFSFYGTNIVEKSFLKVRQKLPIVDLLDFKITMNKAVLEIIKPHIVK
ncbi:hypothetical protein ACTFIW_007681 [Dictyostelium discoideum]